MTQRFRSWKHGPWNQRLKLAEQKHAEIPPAARRNPLTTAARDATLVLVDIDPIPVPTEASKATKPAQTRNTEPKPVDLIATQTKLAPTVAAIQSQSITPPPPNSETADPSSQGDLSLDDPRSEKLQAKPNPATNAAQASKPASPDDQRPQGISSAAAGAVKPVGVSEKPTPPTVPPPRPTLAIDVKAGPFSAYDTALVAAVQKRWYELLDERKSAREGKGRVVVEFRLKYDGHITDLKVTYREVDDILSLICQRAVTDPAPFPAWSRELRRIAGANARSVRFTFVY